MTRKRAYRPFVAKELNAKRVKVDNSKQGNACAIIALSIALDKKFDDVMREAVEANAYNPADGTVSSWTRKQLVSNGWKQITPTKSKRSYRRVPGFKPEHLPSGKVVVFIKKHVVFVEDGIIHDTFDSVKYGLKRIYTYFVPEDTNEDEETFWDRADEARIAKYGKLWHIAEYDHYHVEYGRRADWRSDNGVIPEGVVVQPEERE